jgi:hypothetical protein
MNFKQFNAIFLLILVGSFSVVLSQNKFVNSAPSIPTLNDPGDINTTGTFTITWTASSGENDIDHYELQLDNNSIFTNPLSSYNTSGLSALISGLTNGIYYFRVRAFDILNQPSGWSNIVDIEVEIPNRGWWIYIVIGGGIVIAIVIYLIIRFRKKGSLR